MDGQRDPDRFVTRRATADEAEAVEADVIANPEGWCVLAWTPDEEIERGAEELKRLWPEKWEAWVEWCRAEDAHAVTVPTIDTESEFAPADDVIEALESLPGIDDDRTEREARERQAED